MTCTFVIADLHGRFDLLEAAFSAIHATGFLGDCKIVTLGDYVDRGPQSRQVIEHLMAAQKAGLNLICLKGNHEDMMVETITKPLDPDWWLGNGGSATVMSYGEALPPEHLAWAKGLPTIHHDEHRVFVHAGVDPTKALDQQNEEYLLWHRPVGADDLGHGDRHVIHGHTPNPKGPERYKNRTNLDTLAWRTGRLVIAVFDDELPGPPIDFIEVGPGARASAPIPHLGEKP